MILNVSNLYKTYTRRGEEFNAVEDVEFFAWSGDFSVIYGESGSGKSTLLSLLSGINRPSQGSIIFNGVDFASLTDAELSAIRNDKIGYIPQESVFLPQFTVLENIFLPRAIREGNKIENVTASIRREGLFRRLQSAGESNWKAYKKHKWLKPFCWIYQSGRYARQGLKAKRSGAQLKDDLKRAENRNKLLRELEII